MPRHGGGYRSVALASPGRRLGFVVTRQRSRQMTDLVAFGIDPMIRENTEPRRLIMLAKSGRYGATIEKFRIGRIKIPRGGVRNIGDAFECLAISSISGAVN